MLPAAAAFMLPLCGLPPYAFFLWPSYYRAFLEEDLLLGMMPSECLLLPPLSFLSMRFLL